MTRRTCAVLVAMAWPWVAGAASEAVQAPPATEPAKAPAVSETPAAPATGEASLAPPATEPGVAQSPSVHPAAAAPSQKGFALEAGWGKYEALHAGVAYRFTENAAFRVFGGGGVQGSTTTMSLGAGFSHALGSPIWTMEWGWDLKALYWTQSDPNYDWKMGSVVLGGYLVRDLARNVAVKLDAGAALSFALQSDRKQDLNFAHPTRWNGSVCLELVYRLGGS